MRMWNVDTEIMCRKHLIAEHCEVHAFVGTILKGIDIIGYVRKNLLAVDSLYTRHKQLVREMRSRGYNHNSPMIREEVISIVGLNPFCDDVRHIGIDSTAARADLIARCDECRKLFEEKGETCFINIDELNDNI